MSSYIDFDSVDLFGPQYEIPLSSISTLELTQSDDFKNRLALLFTMMQEMNSKQTVAELFDLAIDYAGRVLQVDRASISYVNEEKGTLTLTALYGVDASNLRDIVLPLKASATGHSYIIDAISYRPRLDNCNCPVVQKLYNAGLHSTMVAPIVSGDTRYGTLNTANKKLDGYNNDDIHLFAQITAILGTHLHNVKLREKAQEQEEILIDKNVELERLANMDPLTKIYNRRHINNILNYEITQMDRHTTDLSLIIMDIDYFKDINDKKGHLIGDAVLCELSILIKKNIRDMDVFARWGGEEFLIACVKTNLQDAFALAEKLRVLIDTDESGNLEDITLSFGVSSFIKDDSMDSLIQRADKALYMSKDSGRNKVTILK